MTPETAEKVREVVDAWPPFTPEQRDHLAALLRPLPTSSKPQQPAA